MSKTFWLHVATDGVETKYAREPADVKTLKVTVEHGYEWTFTINIWLTDGDTEKFVEPRGDGWEFFPSEPWNEEHRGSTRWRRDARRKKKRVA
jgi:hypothetical protein